MDISTRVVWIVSTLVVWIESHPVLVGALFGGLGLLGKTLWAKRPRSVNPSDTVLSYRKALREAHASPPGLFDEHVRDISTVFVELDVQRSANLDGVSASRTLLVPRTLRELLEEGRSKPDHANRWVILGDPGAGKSTLARHLTWEQANHVHGPLPVYASLPRLVQKRCHPFELAAEDLQVAVGKDRSEGLSRILFEKSKARDGLWLFLDGLDEVSAEQREEVNAQIRQWERMSEVTIVILTRPVGYKSPGDAFQRSARIQKLTRDKQQKLLDKWLGPSAGAVWQHIDASTALREACEVPLMLSLLAFWVKDTERRRASSLRSQDLPTSRLRLFEQGIDVLLERGHGYGGREGVVSSSGARAILRELSLALYHSAAESWTLESLELEVAALIGRPDSIASLHIGEKTTWRSAQTFLRDVSRNSGLLASHDGPDAPWRFLHRQFRELLAAEALHKKGHFAVLEKAQELSNKPEQIPTWAEVLGFACELAEDPLEVLAALSKANEELALRVMPALDRIDLVGALSVLQRDGKWDGDFLRSLFQRWKQQGQFRRDEVCRWLWRQVDENRSTLELAYFYYALECLGESVRPGRFFGACRRPMNPSAAPTMVSIPARNFLMGSRRGEAEHTYEGPQHMVSLGPFELSATAVTNAQYAVFDSAHLPESFGGKLSSEEAKEHPVVTVSWWEAYLYCKWAGGSLPTEAQWECACRADTSGVFSFDGEISTDLVNYNGIYPHNLGSASREMTVRVASLAPNPWRLYEMHGNVFEWCLDCLGDYRKDLARPGDGFRSGNETIRRIIRGGSWKDFAVMTRSAARDGVAPSTRTNDLGFRIARTA